ncbi:MAG: hypothetical protein R3C61_18805 [Bacteroidia bacterium]
MNYLTKSKFFLWGMMGVMLLLSCNNTTQEPDADISATMLNPKPANVLTAERDSIANQMVKKYRSTSHDSVYEVISFLVDIGDIVKLLCEAGAFSMDNIEYNEQSVLSYIVGLYEDYQNDQKDSGITMFQIKGICEFYEEINALRFYLALKTPNNPDSLYIPTLVVVGAYVDYTSHCVKDIYFNNTVYQHTRICPTFCGSGINNMLERGYNNLNGNCAD